MSRGKRIVALMQEIQDSSEYELFTSLRGFKTSIFIFDKNFVDLSIWVNKSTNDPKYQHLHDLRNRDQLYDVMAHIIRMIHNFAAASFSLIDHTRRLYGKLYQTAGEFEDYQPRIETEFINDPLSQFVKGLRQYCQHYKSPDLQISTSWQQGDEKVTKIIELLKDDLIAFGRWNATAKTYLDGLDEKINILEVAQTYHTKVLGFYEWFQSRQMEIHEAELNAIQEKDNELSTLKLESKIEAAFNQKEMDLPHERDEIFLSIFSSREFDELEDCPIDSPERAERAIGLLEIHMPVSDSLKEQIRKWYDEIGSTF